MAKKVHKIHSLPADAAWEAGLPPVGSSEHPLAVRALDRILGVQRPLVVAHVRSIRLRHPEASAEQIIRRLERRYLAAVTSGGAAVGTAAVIPGIGTGVTLALSGAETVGFLESTALFAQSVAEVHGITVKDPEAARALVMTLLLGPEGVELVTQLAKQFSGGTGRPAYWGDFITKSLPKAAVGPLLDRLKGAFLHRLATHGGASIVGKAMPFGVGAVIGGTGNHLLGRRVVTMARKAFGATPTAFPAELEPAVGARPVEQRVLGTIRGAGAAASERISSLRKRSRRSAQASKTLAGTHDLSEH